MRSFSARSSCVLPAWLFASAVAEWAGVLAGVNRIWRKWPDLSHRSTAPWTARDKRLRINRSSFPWLIILCLFLARLNPSLLKSFSMVLLYSTLSFEIHNIRSITILLYTIGLFISQILCLLFK